MHDYKARFSKGIKCGNGGAVTAVGNTGIASDTDKPRTFGLGAWCAARDYLCNGFQRQSGDELEAQSGLKVKDGDEEKKRTSWTSQTQVH